MLIGEMTDVDDGWRLRKVLQTEPRVVVFASATSRFDEIDRPDLALYEMFRIRVLAPLDTDECMALWKGVAGGRARRETIRSLQILTGGSPRLVAIVARFGAARSFRDLMADLLDLVDDHTEYFKGHLESLPPQERRVYLALAGLWRPATAREIAAVARLEVSKCSAQLSRLTQRGVVQIVGGGARRREYYLNERLYNVYYLLRRGQGSARLVEALVRFMEAFYSPAELAAIAVEESARVLPQERNGPIVRTASTDPRASYGTTADGCGRTPSRHDGIAVATGPSERHSDDDGRGDDGRQATRRNRGGDLGIGGRPSGIHGTTSRPTWPRDNRVGKGGRTGCLQNRGRPAPRKSAGGRARGMR